MGIGENLFKILTDEVGWFFMIGFIIATLMFFYKKETGKAIGFLVSAVIVAVIVLTPETFKDFLLELGNKIIKLGG